LVWAIALLALLLIIGAFGYRAEKRADAKFTHHFARSVNDYCRRISAGDCQVASPESYGYHPVRGEVVFAILEGISDHDTKAQGRLIVTSKAVIFETQIRSERLVYSGLSNVEAKRDGVEIRRRKGPRRAYRLTDPNSLGLLVAAYQQAAI